MTSCRQVYQHICEHLDEDLSSPRCRRIRQHIEGCPDCKEYLESLKKTVVLYRAVPTPPVPRVVHRSLARALEQEFAGRKQARTSAGRRRQTRP